MKKGLFLDAECIINRNNSGNFEVYSDVEKILNKYKENGFIITGIFSRGIPKDDEALSMFDNIYNIETSLPLLLSGTESIDLTKSIFVSDKHEWLIDSIGTKSIFYFANTFFKRYQSIIK